MLLYHWLILFVIYKKCFETFLLQAKNLIVSFMHCQQCYLPVLSYFTISYINFSLLINGYAPIAEEFYYIG